MRSPTASHWPSGRCTRRSAGSTELIKRTVAAIRLGLDTAGFLARQREVLLRRMRELGDVASSDPLAVLVHDHAIAHLDADLHWLDTAAERLATSSEQGES